MRRRLLSPIRIVPSSTGETFTPARRSRDEKLLREEAAARGDEILRLAARKDARRAVVALARLRIERLHAAPQRRGDGEAEDQRRQIGCDAGASGSSAREREERFLHAAASVPASRTTLPRQPRREPRAMGDHQKAAAGFAHEVERERQHGVAGRLRRDCRSVRRRAAVAAARRARGRRRRAAAGRRIVARDSAREAASGRDAR